MIKTIKVKKQMGFGEIVNYILENNIRDTHFDSETTRIVVSEFGGLKFDTYSYGTGETYKVEEAITGNTKLDHLIEVAKGDLIHTYEHDVTINEVLDADSKVFYTLLDGELVKVWERDSDE